MLTGEYPPRAGGVSDYTERLTCALRARGHEVEVLTSRVNGVTDETAPRALRRVRDWGFSCWRQVNDALDENGADVLHIQYQPGAFQLKGAVNLLPIWLRRRRPRIRIVTTFHDLRVPYLFPKAGPLRKLAVQALVRSSHGAVFVDAADLTRVGPGPGRRWVPIGSNIPCSPPPGFDRAVVRKVLGAGPDDLLIGYFGFLSAEKGADTLLRALRLLLDEGRPARLALIGATAGASSPSDRTDATIALELADRLGLGGHLSKTGYLDSSGVSAHLLACDVIALPYKDGASFRRGSLLAAMEHGRPVVTTLPSGSGRGIPPLILEPERHMLAVRPDDPSALAAAIGRLANDASLAARLSGEARLLAERCSWGEIAEVVAGLYGECLAG